MSKEAFASSVINKMKAAIGNDGGSFNGGSASSAMSAVADAITQYIIDNTKVTVAYVGTIPGSPPSPDPVTSDSFKVVGKCAPPGPSNSFDSWMKELESNIISGFSLAPSGNKGLVFPAKPFANVGITTTQSQLKSAHGVGDTSPQQKMWEIICGGIMDWVNGIAKNAAPGTATRPSAPSSGTATIVQITIT